ncbi:hypothetical protein HMI55_004123, partial [Coelomomyces lativittatus]
MGTNAAIHLANLYLAYEFDQKLSTTPNILFYYQYIDDFICAIGPTTDLSFLTNLIQEIHP